MINYDSRSILFIESSPTDMLAKMAQVLKKKGYKTNLITLMGNTKSNFLRESYEKLIPLDFKFFKINFNNLPKIMLYGFGKFQNLINLLKQINNLKPNLIIVRTTPNWLCFLIKKYFKKIPIIYFPYDIRSFCYKDLSEAKIFGIPKFEIAAEKWCFENCDGIIHKGEDKELSYLNEKILGKVHIKSPSIHFLPYCISNLIIPLKNKKISKKEINMVFVGHIGLSESWVKSIKMVLKNKIHLHLYGKTANLSDKDSSRSKEYQNFLNNKYFHLHSQVDQKDLSKEISKYDYGIWMGYYDIWAKNITTCTGNKLASYLEAGLPIIYFRNHDYIGRILKKYGAGIGIEINTDLKKLLLKQNYKKLLKNIEKARKDLLMEKHIPRLEVFFKEVIKYHNNRK